MFGLLVLVVSVHAAAASKSKSVAGAAKLVKQRVRKVAAAKKKGKVQKNAVRTLVETRKCRCEPCSTGLGPLQEVQARMLKGQLHNQQGYVLNVRNRLSNLLKYLQTQGGAGAY